jgi:hypothetical protein
MHRAVIRRAGRVGLAGVAGHIVGDDRVPRKACRLRDPATSSPGSPAIKQPIPRRALRLESQGEVCISYSSHLFLNGAASRFPVYALFRSLRFFLPRFHFTRLYHAETSRRHTLQEQTALNPTIVFLPSTTSQPHHGAKCTLAAV